MFCKQSKELSSQVTSVSDVTSQHVTVALCLRGCKSTKYADLSEKPCLNLFLWGLPRQYFLLKGFKLCKDKVFTDHIEI